MSIPWSRSGFIAKIYHGMHPGKDENTKKMSYVYGLKVTRLASGSIAVRYTENPCYTFWPVPLFGPFAWGKDWETGCNDTF
jgi:hypothetical protein